MPDQVITKNETVDGVDVTTITEAPEYTNDTIKFSHDVVIGAQDPEKVNLAIVIDRSWSTLISSGSDLDGDNSNDSFIEAQKIAAKEIAQKYIDLGYDPASVSITLVDFGSSGNVVGRFTLDNLAAYNDAVDDISVSGFTNYADPLAELKTYWDGLNSDGDLSNDIDPTASNNVIFMSDGAMTSTNNPTDEAQALTNAYSTNITAIGLGNDSSTTDLDLVDNTGGAEQITDISTLVDTLTAPPDLLDVDKVEVTFTYEDPNNPGSTLTQTETYLVSELDQLPDRYALTDETVDLVPDPPIGTNITMEVKTYFNNGGVSISSGAITVPAFMCFSADTLILTDRGEVRAGDLQAGDMVRTVDHGFQEIRWVGSRKITPKQLLSRPSMRPVQISAGALGPQVPQRSLTVSPQHRILLTRRFDDRAARHDEVLVAAKSLVGEKGVSWAEIGDGVEYVHIAFSRHELIFSEGVISESLYAGPQALRMLLPEQRKELLSIFPEWSEPDFEPVAARPIPKGADQREIVARLSVMNMLSQESRTDPSLH
ncbi:intein N-terminal splicing region [Paracoccus isoporae]|uniref:Intein N-terminal splicing region n=1 Tax=Paracoccus isoporae TaxID=591205 RepID=A0A1G6TFP7_9RHOB|nr:Hint domain-containing protein [Paracoccus isoporae]SDD27849.1 intein N-terminal splicing region [Paracoccus isoporae]